MKNEMWSITQAVETTDPTRIMLDSAMPEYTLLLQHEVVVRNLEKRVTIN